MKAKVVNQSITNLDELCVSIRKMVADNGYESCIELIYKALENNPHAPQPHNLLGIVLEKNGDHLNAMKHFRKALDLDPAYMPAYHNLYIYGTFISCGKCAFDESDVPLELMNNIEIVYDEQGIGHVVNKTK